MKKWKIIEIGYFQHGCSKQISAQPYDFLESYKPKNQVLIFFLILGIVSSSEVYILN